VATLTAIDRELYMKSGQGFLLVFSLTNPPSLRELSEIREQLIRIKDDPNIPIVLVGNKSDLPSQITRERIQQSSQGWGNTPYYETSARRRVNVDDAFRDLVRQIMIKERKAEKAMAAQDKSRAGNGSADYYDDGLRQYDDEPQQEQRRRNRKRDRMCVIL
jgi:Ras-related protein Rap-1B